MKIRGQSVALSLEFVLRRSKENVLLLFYLAILVAFPGCSILPIGTNANVGPVITSPMPTRATEVISPLDLKDGVFLGIAMSGGGSRAANFSAAALLELERLGILDKSTVISSVSGSSITAAYYGLYGTDKDRWNEEQVRRRLGRDFESQWITRWFYPHNIFRYWLSDFDRSDIMKAVFDSLLFEGKLFRDMPNVLPKILINATSLTDQEVFRFTDEIFTGIGSRLDSYPVSHAVMASGAFPGAFPNVTLRNYVEKQRYIHLFDGGPSDNLGVETLLRTARKLYQTAGDRPKSCFVIVLDAFTNPWNTLSSQRDTRGFADFFVDTNALDASGALLALRRNNILEQLNLDLGENAGRTVYSTFSLFPDEPDPKKQVKCGAWLLSFQRLTHVKDKVSHATGLDTVVNNVPTRYRLIGPHGMDSTQVQDALFEAAKILVREDKETVQLICKDYPFLTLCPN
jgi:predicted acylesterase/phospholipase RssA